MRNALFDKSYKHARKRPVANPCEPNSPNCYDARGSGILIVNEITIVGAGASINLFQITGTVELMRIYGVVTDVTNIADLTLPHLALWDSAADVLLSAAAGPDCSGVPLGSSLIKTDAAANALALLNATNGAIYESDKKEIPTPTVLQQKTGGVDTFTRFKFTSAGGLNCKIKWFSEWRHMCGDSGNVVAV